MSQLILLRHGQSEWNKRNLFTGWVDVPLSQEGIDEAFFAGDVIKDVRIDIVITTTLIRAQMTAMLVMTRQTSGNVPVILHPGEGNLEAWGKIYGKEAENHSVPVLRCWELNERAYGELQGLNKAETMEKFGEAQVKVWRRSYATAPPGGESLEMTAARSIPYFKEKIVPLLKKGKNVLVCAHGNSLRSIIMHLDGLSKEEVVHLELATGFPIVYDFENGSFTKQKALFFKD